MSIENVFFQPSYVKKFFCDGQKCGAQCCKRWIINIDTPTLNEYAQIESPTKEITSKIKMSAETGFYAVTLDENLNCPFLTAENLCTLQKKYGEKILSSTCQTFPRSIYQIADICERSLSLTCPIVAELALTPNAPMEFEIVKEIIPRDTKIVGKIHKVPPEIIPYILEIQLTAIKILQERNLPLDLRLTALEIFLDRVEESVADGNFDEINPLAETYRSQNFLLETFLPLASKLDLTPPHFIKAMLSGLLETFQDSEKYLSALREILNLRGNFSIDELCTNYVKTKIQREKFVAKFSTVFENYLVNNFFLHLYPYRVEGSINHNFGVFLTSYKIIELVTFCAAENKADLIKIISEFEKKYLGF